MPANPLFPVSPLESVREGMLVVDEHGRRLGTVARVRLGHPDAVTPGLDVASFSQVGLIVSPLENTGGTTSVGVGAPFPIDGIGIDPDVPDELRLELLRTGFIELDAPGLRGPARYIHGDQIAEVSDNTVRLRPSVHD
jgi:hypothetical protein